MSDLAIANRVDEIVGDLRTAFESHFPARIEAQAKRTADSLDALLLEIEDDLPTPEIICQACGNPECQGCFQERESDERNR